MGVTGGILLHGELWHTHGNTFHKAFYLSGTIAVCIGVYLVLSYLLKSEEASYVMEMVKQKFRK
jgi:hypothetical protein